MEKDIRTIMQMHDYFYTTIPGESLENIHSLFIKNKKFKPTTSIETLYVGVYWELKNNVSKMLKYYKIAADKNCFCAMSNLGLYYNNIKDFETAIYYYSMASKNGSASLMATENKYAKLMYEVALCCRKKMIVKIW